MLNPTMDLVPIYFQRDLFSLVLKAEDDFGYNVGFPSTYSNAYLMYQMQNDILIFYSKLLENLENSL